MYLIYAYGTYLFISVSLVVWVAATLRRHGRLFLVDACRRNEGLADSLNHLLNVGFYLLSLGLVTLLLPMREPRTVQAAIEALSTKEGQVLLLLGAMHFCYLGLIARARRQGRDGDLPFAPDAEIVPPAA